MARKPRLTSAAIGTALLSALLVGFPVGVAAGAPTASYTVAGGGGRTAARARLTDPGPVAVGEGFVWVTHRDDDGAAVVSRFDPTSGRRVGAPIPHGLDAPRIAVGDGAVWVAGEVLPSGRDPLEIRLIRIDARTGARTAGLNLPFRSNFNAVAVGFGAVWVADPAEHRSALARVDPATVQLDGLPIAVGGEPLAVATGFGAVWTADHDDGTVTRVEPRNGMVVATIDAGAAPHGMAVGAGAVWTANWHDRSLTRIDPATDRAADAQIVLNFRPGAIAAGDGALWVAAEPDEEEAADDRVARIDPASGAVAATLRAGGRVVALAASGGALWVVTAELGALLKVVPDAPAPGTPERGAEAGAPIGQDGVPVSGGDRRLLWRRFGHLGRHLKREDPAAPAVRRRRRGGQWRKARPGTTATGRPIARRER